MKRILLLGSAFAVILSASAEARTVRSYNWAPVQIGATTVTEDHWDDRDHHDRHDWRDRRHDRDHDWDDRKSQGWRKGGKCPPGHRMKGEC